MGMRIYNTVEAQDAHRRLSANLAGAPSLAHRADRASVAPAVRDDARTPRADQGAVVSDQALNRARLMAENLQASVPRIPDADTASAVLVATRQQILDDADTAILAQANVPHSGALRLLQ